MTFSTTCRSGAAPARPANPEAAGRTYVVCDGEAYFTRRVHLAMARALGRAAPTRMVPAWALRGPARAGDLAGWLTGRPAPFDSAALRLPLGSGWYSPARIGAELGWWPRQRLEASLPAMVAAYREQMAQVAARPRSKRPR